MLKENRYNVLLVSSSEQFNKKTVDLLSSNIYVELTVSTNIEQARRLIVERKFDIVIVDSPVNNDKGFYFVLSICDKDEFGILVLAKQTDYDEAYFRLHDYGVFVLSKPIEEDLFVQTLRIISLTRDKISSVKQNNLSFKDKLDEIKLVSEAKVLIVKNMHVDENEAHKLIEQNAMNLRITKKMSAEMFIKKYS